MPIQKENWTEKVSAGWWNGCNSSKTSWLLPDTQYRWGINTVCRGGIIQTRPGYRLRLTLPAGNLQGMRLFKPSKDESIVDDYCLVFAVDGKVYYNPYPFEQPASWEPFRLKNIQFNPSARNIYWANAEKTLQQNEQGQLTIVPTYSVLMMQDGETSAAYWDGETNAHVDEEAPTLGTPIGTWMAWAGNRLWVARGRSVVTGDISDPLHFAERTTGPSAGDFLFDDLITGLATVPGENRQSNLIVFTNRTTFSLLASVLDRDEWAITPNFQSVLYSNLGCVSGRSITSHAGLLWWFAQGGLVSSDSVMANFLTSEIKYKDIEMANSKRNLAPDTSNVASASFENYLLISVPSGDELNAHTWVMDSASTGDILQEEPPAWNGIWTGIRPIEWATDFISGQKRIFAASTDYQALADGSFNHIWEAFDPSRTDSFEILDASNTRILVQSPIFCSWETKLYGDGMDYKRMRYADADLVEIGGEVNLRVSFGGTRGGFHEIGRKRIIATINGDDLDNEEARELWNRLGYFRVQSRRFATSDTAFNLTQESDCSLESPFTPDRDKAFSLLFQWCGRMGIEAIRLYQEVIPENVVGECSEDEDGINIVTEDGVSFHFD